jgi:hypothetical protein
VRGAVLCARGAKVLFSKASSDVRDTLAKCTVLQFGCSLAPVLQRLLHGQPDVVGHARRVDAPDGDEAPVAEVDTAAAAGGSGGVGRASGGGRQAGRQVLVSRRARAPLDTCQTHDSHLKLIGMKNRPVRVTMLKELLYVLFQMYLRRNRGYMCTRRVIS